MSSILSTFEKLSTEKQNEILNSAADVFAQEGFHYASISNICKQAQISNGALYKYFENKEDLFIEVLEWGVSLVESQLYRKHMINADSVFEAITQLLKGLQDMTKNQLSHLKIYSNLGASSMNRFAAVASEKYKNSTSIYTLLLVQRGKESGELNPGIENEIAACMIDNYITLYAYSLVSEYHMNRFNSFFPEHDSSNMGEWLIDKIVESLRILLT